MAEHIKSMESFNLDEMYYDFPEKKDGYYYSDIYLVKKQDPVRVVDEIKISETLVLEKKPEPEVLEIKLDDKKPLILKLKSLKKKHSGIIKHESRYYIDLYDEPVDFISKIDDHNILSISENSPIWFPNKKEKIPLDLVEQMYKRSLSVKGSHGSVFRVPVSLDCEVYEKGAKVSFQDVLETSELTLAVSLDNLWLNRKTAGSSWLVRQIKVKNVIEEKKSKKEKPQIKLEGYALPSDNEDEPKSN